VNVDTLVNAVVLQGADQFKSGAVANVGEPRIPMTAEISL
jgi:hypothetical protein